MDELDAVVAAVDVPVQAVGGLTHRAGDRVPGVRRAAGGARRAAGDRRQRLQAGRLRSRSILREICSEIRKTPMPPRAEPLDASRVEIMAATQAAVVQYALEPLSVELREIPVPEIGEHDVLLQVGAVSVCGSDVHQFHATHSWAVNVPVVARPRVRRHGREGRARGARRQGRRPRRQRDRRRDLRHLPDVPHRPLQPVPDAQGLRLRRQRRDGVLRRDAGALPARDPRHAALRARLPVRAARRRLQRRCASTRRSVPATWWWCSAPARSACCARGWRRSPAPTRWSSSGCRRMRRGSRQRARSAPRTPSTSRPARSRRSSRSLDPLGADSCVKRRAPAVRSTRRSSW